MDAIGKRQKFASTLNYDWMKQQMLTQDRLNRLRVINSNTNDERSVAVIQLVTEVEELRARVAELERELEASSMSAAKTRAKSVFK